MVNLTPQVAGNAQVATQPKQKQTLGTLMQSSNVMSKLVNVLGNEKKASAFASSVLSVANGNNLLRNADPMTVLGSAMVAATLDLSVVPTLGEAYIVPYKNQAQFQLGWKGLVELAMRSGRYKNIICEKVCEGELVKKNKFTGEYVFDEDGKTSDKVIGYMAYFSLTDGFSKTVYWTIDEIKAHAEKFSQTYKSDLRYGKKTSVWSSNFDSMAKKTVLKSLISQFGPKSLQMQQAVIFEQGVPKVEETEAEEINLDINSFGVEYVDNDSDQASKEDIAKEAMRAALKDAEVVDTETGEIVATEEK